MFQPAYNSKGKIVDASNEEKGNDTYTCIECGNEMILKKGTKKKAHFAHKAGDEHKNCSGESLLHKAGKIKLKELLEEGRCIQVKLKCVKNHKLENVPLLLGEGCSVVMEKGFEYNNNRIIPDLTILDVDGNVLICLEIFHTHRQSGRPEPWYEFRAEDVLGLDTENLILEDCREYRRCDDCGKCRGSCYIEQSETKWTRQYDCGQDCILHECEHCKKLYPEQWLMGEDKECISCEYQKATNPKYKSLKEKLCQGNCWVEVNLNRPLVYRRDRDCGENCQLMKCKKCGNSHPECRLNFVGEACVDCHHRVVFGSDDSEEESTLPPVKARLFSEPKTICASESIINSTREYTDKPFCRKCKTSAFQQKFNCPREEHYFCARCYQYVSSKVKCWHCKKN